MPLSKLRIGYVKTEFEAQPADGRGGAAATAAAAAGRGGARPPEQQRAQDEARLKILNDALDVYRKAGATLQPIEVPGARHREHDRVHPQRRSGGGVRRPDAQQGHQRPVAQHLAEHVPHAPLRAGGRVHPRAARAHAAHPRDGHADVAVRRVPVADQQPQPRPDEPDRPPGDGAARRLPRGTTPVELMITGRLYDEATMLRVALAHEQATTWHTRTPTLK